MPADTHTCPCQHIKGDTIKPLCPTTKIKKNQGLYLKHLAWGRKSWELRLFISKTKKSLQCSKRSCPKGALWRTCESGDLFLISMDCGPTSAHPKKKKKSVTELSKFATQIITSESVSWLEQARFSPHFKAATKEPTSRFRLASRQYFLTAGADFIFHLRSGICIGKQQQYTFRLLYASAHFE